MVTVVIRLLQTLVPLGTTKVQTGRVQAATSSTLAKKVTQCSP